MTKILTLATEVQKTVFTEILLPEIASGFWKNARPADHADSWKGITINVGAELGTSGFDVPRNYNFVNPDFFSKAEDRLMASAKNVNPDITVKQLKKQLIALNQILGARLTTIGGTVSKLPRGRKQSSEITTPTTKKTAKASIRRVAANFTEPTVETTTVVV